MSKKLILIIAAVLLLGGAYAAKAMLLKPAKTHDKITGTIYLLPKEFLVNLTDGRYGKVDVALQLAPGQSDGSSAASGGASSDATLGTLPEEAVVRSIITNAVTGQNSSTLVDEHGRAGVEQQILRAIDSQTDIKVKSVLFPDLTVQ